MWALWEDIHDRNLLRRALEAVCIFLAAFVFTFVLADEAACIRLAAFVFASDEAACILLAAFVFAFVCTGEGFFLPLGFGPC
tara:strand:- start:156 stop:401 length:246 start_codon:yes stop_codon:yes gene_type:complete